MKPGNAKPKGLLAQRLLALFVVGWAVFDFPLLGLALGDGTLAGLPKLPLALFAAWAALIALLAVLMERTGGDE